MGAHRRSPRRRKTARTLQTGELGSQERGAARSRHRRLAQRCRKVLGMRIVVARDATSAARAAAAFIGDRLTRALARKRGATLAVSGGRSAMALFEALAEQPLPWQAIDVLQVDERIVPSDHLARNWGLLARSPLARPLAADRTHPIPIELGDPTRVVRRYAETLVTLAGDRPALDARRIAELDGDRMGPVGSEVPGERAAREVDPHACGVERRALDR